MFSPTLLNPFDKEITDQKGRDPVQAAARTDVAQAVWIGLCKGSLPAYYPDGIRMPVDEVQAAGLSLQGVYVEPVSVNALLKAAVHAELVWTPGGAQIEPRNGRGVSAQARQDVEILETLRRKGYDPRRLPKNPPGKSGVRSEVRKALGAAGAWSGTTVFKRAWQRLRDAGEIADG